MLPIILDVSTKKQATTTDTNITLLLGSDGASSNNAGLTSGGGAQEGIAATCLERSAKAYFSHTTTD